MRIPKKITVGRTKYKVLVNADELEDDAMGAINFGLKIILIRTQFDDGKRVAKEEISNSFWHEMTHAVLFDMGHELYNNEVFVRSFANKLSDAIDSAKF